MIQNIDVKKIRGNDAWNQWGNLCFKEIYHIYINITELESLDFPRILRQSYIFEPGMPLCQIWWLLHDTRTTRIMLRVKMLRSLAYTLRTSCFRDENYGTTYFSKSQHEIPWLFPDICPFSKFSWHYLKFPDLEKIKFPWLVATL